MHKILVTALAAVSFVAGSGIAHATNVKVTVFETIGNVNEQVASWIQSETPTPDAYVSGYYTTVPVFDATGLGGDNAVTWYSGTNDQLGGFTNYDEDFNVLAQTSYTSDESAPSFVAGTYHGVNVRPDYSYLVASYTIAVLPEPLFKQALSKFHVETPQIAAVPEPTSWAMMFAGLGMIGFVVRRRLNVSLPDA